jgi:hypothetical protein
MTEKATPAPKTDKAQDVAKPKPSDKLAIMNRERYLKSKGINPNEQHQLSLLFPKAMSDEKRLIPNDYARSSLFTARGRKIPRRALQGQVLFHLHAGSGVSIRFSGIELRADDDELVWLQIMHYARKTPLGEPVQFKLIDLVRDIGWHKNTFYYSKARECINRLKANAIEVDNHKAYGKGGAISLIHHYETENDANGSAQYYTVWIDRAMITLFAGSTFTMIDWPIYRSLSPTARRLTDYVCSHKEPLPLSLKDLHDICDSGTVKVSSWNQTVRNACQELLSGGIVKHFMIDKGLIHTVR